MSAIRVFLLTCRRPALLPRALASLRTQTHQDWICELHNDAPEDDFPGRLVQQVGDHRIILHQHEHNWGAVRTFNHAFAGGPEPYASILEDDNWWEPGFLATALAALAAHPDANVVWANMRIVQEQADGSWRDTGRNIWRTNPADTTPRLFRWPQPLQFTDALHSNGAMLFVTAASRRALVPAELPFAIIEPARERLLPGAWLFLPQSLASFALTLKTARTGDRVNWAGAQLLVAASYLAAVPVTPDEMAGHWRHLRTQYPPSTALLFHLAFSGIRTCAILRHARPSDWLRFLGGAIRHPCAFWRSLRFRSAFPQAWMAMRDGACARSRETSAAHSSLGLHEKILPAPAPNPQADRFRNWSSDVATD